MKPPTIPGYTVFWSDDFSGSGSPTPQSWMLETPATNNNNEQQKYTNSTDNAYVSNGQLLIVPLKQNNVWTSARMQCRPHLSMRCRQEDDSCSKD
jgi:hypothetical protein